jgi:hypothetical protein
MRVSTTALSTQLFTWLPQQPESSSIQPRSAAAVQGSQPRSRAKTSTPQNDHDDPPLDLNFTSACVRNTKKRATQLTFTSAVGAECQDHSM